MKKSSLFLSALALSIGMAMAPVSSALAAETASSSTSTTQLPSLAPMLEKVMPSVVSVNVEGSAPVKTPRMGQQFQQFFGQNSPLCQDGSPFQGSPVCQGGGQGPDGQPAPEQKKISARWVPASSLMPTKVMWLPTTTLLITQPKSAYS